MRRKWAQRADCIYLTIIVSDVKDEKIALSADKLSFSGTGGDGQSPSAGGYTGRFGSGCSWRSDEFVDAD